ncbi:hypothetical protein [Catellatospora citrea]|uniref:Uncharacterized protein n=1 Tax=Catellatospora citrea TaxID=53366 RepID=A0A8J3KL09_9ACTN|nr:hypothetical protein [Catellatospora citrea]RKE06444.1 hypothetical protein C8E86_1264 [Catellatospora citrea]GIG01747.1 hypothetical protein Cci01nite_68400 [Catellatospora citrea]
MPCGALLAGVLAALSSAVLARCRRRRPVVPPPPQAALTACVPGRGVAGRPSRRRVRPSGAARRPRNRNAADVR